MFQYYEMNCYQSRVCVRVCVIEIRQSNSCFHIQYLAEILVGFTTTHTHFSVTNRCETNSFSNNTKLIFVCVFNKEAVARGSVFVIVRSVPASV